MKFNSLVLLALSIPMLFLATIMPSHAQTIRVVIDGNWMDFSATPPIEQNGSVLVPLRGVFENLGAGVNYSPDTKTIEAIRGNTDVVLRLGQDTAVVNGQSEPLLEPPLVVDGTTFVPLRFVAESFGAEVNWMNETQVVEIITRHHEDNNEGYNPPQQNIPPPSVPSYVQDNLFNWRDVPQDQTIPLQSALFDDEGYQLLDTQGETVLVPFAGDNIYTLMFALSNTGGMYLVNYGDHPVLYLPPSGYLANATVPDARWYPFSDYRPSQPVYLSVAPSRPEYNRMRWYHQMEIHGGYALHDQQSPPSPTVNLSINIGGSHVSEWSGYQQYYNQHPSGAPIGQTHPEYYQWANRPHPSRTFQGNGTPTPTTTFVPAIHELPRNEHRTAPRETSISGNSSQRPVFSGGPLHNFQSAVVPNAAPSTSENNYAPSRIRQRNPVATNGPASTYQSPASPRPSQQSATINFQAPRNNVRTEPIIRSTVTSPQPSTLSRMEQLNTTAPLNIQRRLQPSVSNVTPPVQPSRAAATAQSQNQASRPVAGKNVAKNQAPAHNQNLIKPAN